MNYKIFLFIFFLTYSCTTIDKVSINEDILIDPFITKGFTLVYSEDFKKSKVINKKLNNRSLTIFQKNLKKDKFVKITNLINNKSLIAQVGVDANYPNFYNSVISERIQNELEINIEEPYIQIFEINQESTFMAKKAKTFKEEKEVANKAPVEGISIKNISKNDSIVEKNINKSKFNYIIKIADFYFKDTAKLMKDRILTETNIKKVNIKTTSYNSFRVYLGPFNDLNSLKNEFNSIKELNFENLEIIKQ